MFKISWCGVAPPWSLTSRVRALYEQTHFKIALRENYSKFIKSKKPVMLISSFRILAP